MEMLRYRLRRQSLPNAGRPARGGQYHCVTDGIDLLQQGDEASAFASHEILEVDIGISSQVSFAQRLDGFLRACR